MPLYQQLRVWGEAKKLTMQVYEVVKGFPSHERFAVVPQMTRAAMSIGANIAEGQRRGTSRDFRNFICYSEGSLAELQHYLEMTHALGYLSEDIFGQVWQQSIEVERMLQALRSGLDKRMRQSGQAVHQ